MTGLTLTIDEPRWRKHLTATADRTPGLVPVAKGNGYGFGLARLADEATRLGMRTIAVGTPAEAIRMREHFDGDIVVLLPWEANDPEAVHLARDPRVVLTVARMADFEVLANLGGDQAPRVLVECLTSMKRHGLGKDDMEAAVHMADALQVEGWTIHLPMAGDHSGEARALGQRARDILRVPLWFSHVPDASYRALAHEFGQDATRLRLGTKLWLGDPGALSVTATVLDVHPVRRGERIGYHQRPVLQDGWVVVVSGGTANGIGLEAPSSVKSVRQRAISVATGGLEAAGLALSPYEVDGAKRWFVEPPHMQSSLVFLPGKAKAPSVGDEIPVAVRNTIATFDRTAAARVDDPEV
ncbi:alanine racemase [Mariniluteicoccus endophyticus]